jgi:hypothetical protein
MFDQLLERQLRLKNVLTEAEWNRIKDNIKYTWQLDSYFEELKGQEMWTARMNLLEMMLPHLNEFFSKPWITRNVLKFTDDEWEAIRSEFDENPALFNDPNAEGAVDGEVDEDGNPIDPLDDGDELGPDGEMPMPDDDDADAILKGDDPAAAKKPPFGKKPAPGTSVSKDAKPAKKSGKTPPFGKKS